MMFDDSTSKTGSDRLNVTRSLSLQDVTGMLYRRQRCLAGWLIACLGLGVLYLFNAQPTFKITSRVLVQAEGSPLGNGNSLRRDTEFLATQGQIISSPAVVQRAVGSMAEPLTIDPETDPVLAVLNNLTVKALPGTNVLSVAYRCQNSVEGISLVEAILDSYQQFLQEMDDGSRLETLRLLTQSEEQLRGELENREQRYRDLRKQTPLIGQGKGATSLQATMLEELGQALVEVRNRRIDFQNRMALWEKSTQTRLAADRLAADRPQQQLTPVVFNAAAKEPRAESADWSRPEGEGTMLTSIEGNESLALQLLADVKLTGAPNPAQIVEELYRAEVRQKELAQSCGPDHPAMRAMQEKLAAWKDQLRELNKLAPIALRREIDAAVSREDELVALYNKELEKAKGSDDLLIVEKQELDGIERLTTMHSSLVFQLNDWRLVEPGDDAGLGTKMSIIESPTIGTGPVWPKTSILMALCAAIGLLGGIGSVVVLERDMWTISDVHRSSD